ncbi:precorrin-6A synthase (deacetylating) [Xinfangfangia sp. D13-10-4-6]|uniref:precorrin-6A synthase (deacetylating) n=1 Tax=Pseudogemmobacter hezensis TaxID=2737662 RepID=UPI001553024B|nr:precorrin-6A synthase (deacetylating) [Pseudogemmobacter hezensis]NPD16571.1 precorrin-6A synthase (deacetylating) [Pseudogemmobacter hezensis]
MDLVLIGIGTGNPDHLTLQAVKALNAVDLILIPEKGEEKADLADLRRAICQDLVTRPGVVVAGFEMPVRDPENPSYLARVNDWHDAIAQAWAATIDANPGASRVALMVWGDPALYDSTLRIAGRLALQRKVNVSVVPGIMSPQVLAAAHRIPLNGLGAPFLVTTGRRLREEGWPSGADRLVVMLDGACAFQHLPPEGVTIWWGAYVGMPNEITEAGPLAEAGPRILARRQAARAEHGWLMDIYILERKSPAA